MKTPTPNLDAAPPRFRNSSPRPAVTPSSDQTPAGGLAAPPRLHRRPAVVGASIALVILGAFVSLWAYTSLGSAQEVVAVRVDVARGEVVTRDALQVVRVGVDPALQVMPGNELLGMIGKRASADLKAGQLLVPGAITDEVMPPLGSSLVGLSLGAGQIPGEMLRVGDAVRVVSTPGQQGDVTAGEIREFQGLVTTVSPMDASAKVAVVVEVPAAQAPELAARAATGKLAVVLDSRER